MIDLIIFKFSNCLIELAYRLIGILANWYIAIPYISKRKVKAVIPSPLNRKYHLLIKAAMLRFLRTIQVTNII